MIVRDGMPEPMCLGADDMYFGEEEDGRDEVGRQDREEACRQICAVCPLMLPCLESALVHRDEFGVWGGMGEGERKAFRKHLNDEGYRGEVPSGLELYASVREFRRKQALTLRLLATGS